MDIPYKGYTIIANSERQPDGRWLPVADLEANSRGVVTTKPPLRAAPREIRATRADADVVAVKMAKAWVGGREREATPRIPPGQPGHDARAKAPPRARRMEAGKGSRPGLQDGDHLTR